MTQITQSQTPVATFWKDRLAGCDLPTPLVLDSTASGEPGHARVEVWPAGVESPDIGALTRVLDMPIRPAAAGLWGAVLARYGDDQDVVVGVEHDDGTILPLPMAQGGSATGREWIEAVQRSLRTHEEFGGVTLDQIAEWVGRPGEKLLSSGICVRTSYHEAELALVVRVDSDDETLSLEYSKRRFTPAAAERIASHIRTLCASMVASPDAPLDELEMVGAEERAQLLVAFNDTAHDFPRDRCFHHLVEDRAEEIPHRPALVFGGEVLDYQELNQRANRLAHHLLKLGVGPDVRVGIFAERSVEMVVGILGILKAGGAFTPLDPRYPGERLTFMMEDSGAPVLLTQAHLVDQIRAPDTRVICLDRDWPDISGESPENPDVPMDPENLAYVIYTSGSTGRPKGVAIRHRGSLNNVYDLNTRFGVGPGDRLLVLSSLSFDMCVYEVLGTLTAGATMIVPDPSRAGEPGHWAELVRTHGVTVWNSAPQLLEMLVDHVETDPDPRLPSLRLAILGGDWVPVRLPDRFKVIAGDGARFVVLGGATECSIHSTIYEVEKTDPDWTAIPYGRPQWNQSCLVLDSKRRLCPIGVPGELCIGGEGLGRGYLDRPELTAEKFIPNRFSDQQGERLYRTGDLVRIDETGLVHLIGRIDFMVKIRGFRVELGEVEAALRGHDGVKEAIVSARRDDSGDQQLVAYVVPTSGEADDGTVTDQVNRWQEVYEETYSSTAGSTTDPTFHIVGWNSSYTGEPIPAEDMRAWVETTVSRISSLGPRRILEIGCGTGLLLFRLAPPTDRYVGTDFSPSAIAHVESHKRGLGLEHVETCVREARDFTGFEESEFDVVVLNSIVLQFPDVEYVLDVLRGAARVLRPGGAIFVGDVRHLPTLEMYHTSVQLAQADDDLGAGPLRALVEQRIRQEEELLMDPDFFRAAVREIDALDHCVVQVKRGRYLNELSKYRFDATLFKRGGDPVAPSEPITRLEWSDRGYSVGDLAQLAKEGVSDVVLVRGIPNARLAHDFSSLGVLAEADESAPVGQVREMAARKAMESGGVEPEDLFALSGIGGYHFDVRLGSGAAPATFDLVLSREAPSRPFPLPVPEHLAAARTLVNDPLRHELGRDLVPELRRLASDRLPEYMIPGAFVVLDRLPLTPNGKVDRKALPAPAWTRSVDRGSMVEAEGALEQIVASIWAEVLGLDRVGATDGFFELGGHSLKATQIGSRLRDTFGLHVPLSAVLRNPTVSQLAARLRSLGAENDLDVDDVAEVLIEVQALSDEQVGALLEDEGDQPGKEATT